MESTYGDDGDGSSSFWETTTEESLETKFTSYSKEMSSDEGKLVRVKLPSSVHEDMMVCNVNEEQVKPGKKDMQIKILCGTMLMTMLVKSVIETESDKASFNGYACSYEDGEALDNMLLDEMVWDEFISSLSRDAKIGHVQEEQVEEIAAYGDDCEDMMIEDAASVELSKDMADGPWNLEQVIFVEPKEEEAVNTGGLRKEVCASLLMEMLLDVAMQLAFKRLQECLERISALYGWEGRSNRLDGQDSEQDDALLEAERRFVDTCSSEGVFCAFYMHHCVFSWVEHYKRLLQVDGTNQSQVFDPTGRLPLIQDIAQAINQGFGLPVIDKLFYAGQGNNLHQGNTGGNGGGVSPPMYAQPSGVAAASSRNVKRPLFKPADVGNAGNQVNQNNTPSSSSRPTTGNRGGDKGKRPMDSKGFQAVSSRKAFKPRQQSSGYVCPNVFDLLQDIPSPESLAAIEEACTPAERNKLPPASPDINIKVNMTDLEEGSQGVMPPK
ncbi:hypothetical protein L7F22_044564 [Adiantum nelumboides]|nr:hypothetical protein [Adiantum nelumboides]